MRNLIDHILDHYSITLAVVALCLVASPDARAAAVGGALAMTMIAATWMTR